jgi:hypothetical protein
VAKTFPLLLIVTFLAPMACAGCVTFSNELCPVAQPTFPRGVVYVADGAGDFRATSAALERAAAEEKAPLQVQTVTWSHGHGRVVADQLDEMHARGQGWRLAEQIMARHRAHPDEEIYLLAHCAGCEVILAAAEALPPGSVNRIILLAASVPTNYDLRPALRCAREGIDAFYSPADRWCLGIWMRLGIVVGARYQPMAGRFGFRPIVETPEDAACYARLRQHPWQPEWEWTGNSGGHYGCYQPEFLRFFILPLLNHHSLLGRADLSQSPPAP